MPEGISSPHTTFPLDTTLRALVGQKVNSTDFDEPNKWTNAGLKQMAGSRQELVDLSNNIAKKARDGEVKLHDTVSHESRTPNKTSGRVARNNRLHSVAVAAILTPAPPPPHNHRLQPSILLD